MINIDLVAYSQKIVDRLRGLRHSGVKGSADGEAIAVNFSCGSAIRFEVSIDHDGAMVERVGFGSNGCGIMLAGADALADAVSKKKLKELCGLSSDSSLEMIRTQIGPTSDHKAPCIEACIEALREAFANHRRRHAEEFQGERALICTCFAVTEETIAEAISKYRLTTVDDVTNTCGAGGGCGSCTLLIAEMLSGPGIDK